jgi:Ca2+:H+ antiporter
MLSAWPRLAVGWGSVVALSVFGGAWLADLGSIAKFGGFFIWIVAVIVWCSFGVVAHADHLAEKLGEPLGTLIFTLSIVLIEVILIGAVMLGGKAAPTIGRDAMFSVMMIILNGVVGLGLLVGGWRHKEQSYNLQGAAAYLAVIIPMTVIALVLPNLTLSTSDGTLTTVQAISFSVFTAVLYGIFLAIQTGRHRSFFMHPKSQDAEASAVVGAHGTAAQLSFRDIAGHTFLLVLNMLPIVLMSKHLAKLVDHGIVTLEAPVVLGGLLIALIVFTPESITALRAAYNNDLQRTMNLCLGAFVSTIGLTLPAVLMVGLATDQPVVLGVDPAGMALIAVTLVLSALTFSGPRTTVLEGAVHLLVFFVYLVLIFSP